MFDNIKSATEVNDAKEASVKPPENTPPAPPAKEENTPNSQPNASEGAKTPDKESDDLRFDKHSRFRELIQERDDFKKKYEELSPIQQEVARLRETVQRLTGQAPSDVPKFETVEDLMAYAKALPQKIKDEILKDMESKQQAEVQANKEVDDQIQGQLDQLTAQGKQFDEKELLQFALENEITNLEIAFNLLQRVNQAESDGKKKGEEIGKRKADSGLKGSKTPSDDTKPTWRPGMSVYDAIEDAKRGLHS